MGIHLRVSDAAIVVAYLLALVAIGIHFSRRQSRPEDFFLARRGMSWLPVGLSLMAALNSGIDFLAQPSSTIKFGLAILAANLSWVVLVPYVSFVTLPLFRRLVTYSAYEYLELRFHLGVRGLGAAIFMLWRLSWMATALYVPCLAVTSVIGGDDYLVPLIITLGALVTTYTMLGGIKAVIWTDVLQFCVMFAGLTATVVIVWRAVPGGLQGILDAAGGVGIGRPAAPPVPAAGLWPRVGQFFAAPMSVVGMLVAAVVSRIGTYTSDQVMIQRFQTTRSLGDARRSFVITAASDALWMSALAFVGISLFAFHGGRLPAAIGGNTDEIFPRFMGEMFPAGMMGLAIAAILAASLSSVDSALNSLTAVATVDFYQRIFLGRSGGGQPLSDTEGRRAVTISRAFTLVIGIAGIALSCNVGRLGTVFEIANKLINGFTGPLLGIFLLGMFTRRANGAGAFAGGFVGTGVSLAVIYLSSLPRPAIGFLWPSTFGLVATLAVGYIVSVTVALVRGPSPRDARGERWTFSGVLAAAGPEGHREDIRSAAE